MDTIQKKTQVGAERVGPEGAEPEGVEPEGVELEGVEPEHVDPERVEPKHVKSEHVKPDRVPSSEPTDPKHPEPEPERVDTDPEHIDPDHVDPKRAATGTPALQTPYMVMSVQANLTAMKLDVYAIIFSWLILAGYVVLPNTFTSLQNADSLAATAGGKAIQDAVRNVPLLPFAGVLCCIGAAGSCWLWWLRRRNYVWLISHIFL
jgi:hypothetical protein